MSSSATGPYKSRLLNFVNRQSLQVRDRLERTVRHVKVAVEWGVQILVYPIYLLVQTGRMMGTRLQQSVTRDRVPQLSEAETQASNSILSCDRAIEQVLQVVEPWFSPSELEDLAQLQSQGSLSRLSSLFKGMSSFSKTPGIQGVASLLETQTLVLVTSDNQILDILSANQTKEVQKSISIELANYYYQRRLQQTPGSEFPGLIPKFEQPSPQILAPMRFFWRVMRWVQTSPIAIAINLFGESQFTNPISSHLPFSSAPVSNGILPHALVDPLDGKIAELEAQQFFSLTSWLDRLRPGFLSPKSADSDPLPPNPSPNSTPNNPWQIQALIQSAINYFFKPSSASSPLPPNQSEATASLPGSYLVNLTETPAIKRLREWVQKLPPSLPFSSPALSVSDTSETEPDPFRIQMLIQAAIDYFFVQTPRKLQWQGNSNYQGNGLPSSQNPFSLTGKTPISLPNSQVLESALDEDPWLSWEDLYSETPPTDLSEAETFSSPDVPPQLPGVSSLAISAKKISSVTPTGSQSLADTSQPANPVNQSVTPFASQAYEIETAYDWIEAEAQSTGYVKHPLERILEWLDKIILWVEEIILKVWNWLRSR